MSPRLLFGFQFGSPAAPSSATTAAAPFWTALHPSAQAWGSSRFSAVLPRFERVFPAELLPSRQTFASTISLVYHVTTEFPFIVATANDVRLYSDVTMPD